MRNLDDVVVPVLPPQRLEIKMALIRQSARQSRQQSVSGRWQARINRNYWTLQRRVRAGRRNADREKEGDGAKKFVYHSIGQRSRLTEVDASFRQRPCLVLTPAHATPYKTAATKLINNGVTIFYTHIVLL